MATATAADHDAAPVELALHPGQSEVYRARTTARFRVVVSGRRWGKTTLDKAEVVTEFGTPGLVWFLGPTYDMVRDLMWEPLRNLIPRAWLVADPNETRMECETVWGCRFACKSVEHPDRLRGRGPRMIVGDEYQEWKDGQRTWEEVLLPSLLTSNGTALLTGTPKSFNHLYQAFDKGQRGVKGWQSWQFLTASAPHIPQDYLAQMRADMDPRAYRQEFEASFEAMAGRAYYAFARAHNVAPVVLERGDPVVVFFDFNVDPATAGVGQVQGDRAMVWREVRLTHRGGEATLAAGLRVRDLLQQVGHDGPVRIYGDATGRSAKTTGPADHAVIRDLFPSAVWCIPGHNPHEKDRVAAVNAMCESMDGRHRLIVDPVCRGLIADLEQVIYGENGELDKQSNPMLTHHSDGLGYWLVRDFPTAPKLHAGAARIDWLL